MHTRQSKQVTYHEDWIKKVLAAEIVAPLAELVDTPQVKLIKDGAFAPTPQSLLALFTAAKADFTDYTDKALTLTGPRNTDGSGLANGGVVNWLMTTSPTVTGNRIYGYYIQDADGVVAYEMFSEADQIDMTEPGDSLIMEILLPLLYLQPVESAE